MNAYVFMEKVIQCGVRLVWSEEKVKCEANRDEN